MAVTTSYNLDKARQVLGVTERILQNQGKLAGICLANGKRLPQAKATKVEKKQFRKGRISTVITTGTASAYFDTTAKSFVLTSTANLLPNDILRFEVTATGKRVGTLEVMVIAITNSTTVTAMKVGGVDIALTTSHSAVFVSNALPENSAKSTKRPINQPTTVYNYTQILKEGREISGTAMQVQAYSEETARAELRGQVYEDFGNSLNGLCSGTSRIELTNPSTGDTQRVAGGLHYFGRTNFLANGDATTGTPANVVDKSGATFVQTMVDDGFEYVIKNGGVVNAILCSPTKARLISGFDASKINIFLSDVARGGAVQVLKSPIKVNGNQIDAIYVDTEMPQDEVIMFNQDKIYLVPMQNRDAIESEIGFGTSETDGVALSLLGEWTFLADNIDINSYILTNLA